MFENRNIPEGVQLLYKLQDSYESKMSYTTVNEFTVSALLHRPTKEFVKDAPFKQVGDP
jgi:hypothetical protein